MIELPEFVLARERDRRLNSDPQSGVDSFSHLKKLFAPLQVRFGRLVMDAPAPRNGKGRILIGQADVAGVRRDDELGLNADFVISEKLGRPLEIVSYSFQLLAPENCQISPFRIRYDYTADLPANPNEHPQCHLTVDNQEMRMPCAFMTPAELVHVFLNTPAWWHR